MMSDPRCRRVLHSALALSAAFQGQWADGEIGLMAEFLASQGKLQPAALATEQLRQLRALSHIASEPDERLPDFP